MVKRIFLVALTAMSAMHLQAELITPQNTNPQTDNLAASAIKAKDMDNQLQMASSSIMDKLNDVSAKTIRNFSQTGTASWYGRQFHGRKTATGERFNMNAMTAAHPNLPLNCRIRVTNQANGKSIVVKVNDRGPFHGNRILDLSYGAAKALDITDKGTTKVRIERIDF